MFTSSFSEIMFQFTDIKKFHYDLLTEKLSCLQVVNYYLEEISKNEHLNAIVDVYENEAVATAARLDEQRANGKPLGKLHGVVITIKDNIYYEGHRVTAASKMLAGNQAVYTATAVQRLIDEEAIIIGSCNCDEFAMGSTGENSYYGRTLHPLNENLVPGGSSGGSAVSVSADLCMVAIGSDTGGSVRQPADFCGVTGYKPSYGRVSRHGLIPYASSLDQIGIIAKSPADVGLVLDVISGRDEKDSTAVSGDLDFRNEKDFSDFRIALIKTALEHDGLDTDIQSAILRLFQQLSGKVSAADEVDLPLLSEVVPLYYVLTAAEGSSNLNRYDGVRYGFSREEKGTDLASFYKANRSAGFGREVKKRIMLGNFILSNENRQKYYTQALKVRRMISDQLRSLLCKYDVLIMPTTLSTAFESGEAGRDRVGSYLADVYTVPANLAGLPAISVPLFRHPNGLPFGVQLLSAENNEVNLLAFAEQLMRRFRQT